MNDTAISPPRFRVADAGRGLGWWQDAWPLFTRSAGMWIVLMVVTIVASLVVGIVPLLGGLVVSLFTPVVIGSFMLAARKVDDGGTLAFDDLYAGFRDRLAPLVVIGAMLLAASLVLGIVVAVLGGGAMIGGIGSVASGSERGVMAALGAGLLFFAIAMAVGLLIGMALWFAPALVVFRGVTPVDAIKASFSASLANIVPFTVFGVVYIVAAVVASIPFGLGWLVLAPLVALTMYVSYKDVFGT
jgi:hypothetical protein